MEGKELVNAPLLELDEDKPAWAMDQTAESYIRASISGCPDFIGAGGSQEGGAGQPGCPGQVDLS